MANHRHVSRLRAADGTPGIGLYIVLALFAHAIGLYFPLRSRVPPAEAFPLTVLRFEAKRTPAGPAPVVSAVPSSQRMAAPEPTLRVRPASDLAVRESDAVPPDRAAVTHRNSPRHATDGNAVEPQPEELVSSTEPRAQTSVASIALPGDRPHTEASQLEGQSAANYAQILAGWLQRHHNYPFYLRKQGVRGDGSLRLRVQRDGTVALARMDRSLPDERLDEVALDMVRDADPFPPMPDALPGPSFECVIEVRFQLDQ